MMMSFALGFIEIKQEVMEPSIQWLIDGYAKWPMLGLFFALCFIDVCTGLCAAFITKTLSSTISWAGMVRKIVMLLMVVFAAVLEQIGTGGIPAAKMTAGFFCITEALSIIENAARSGVPIPPFLLDTLQRLKNSEKASVASSSSTVTIQHASNVSMDVHDDVQIGKSQERMAADVRRAAAEVRKTAKDVAADLKDVAQAAAEKLSQDS